MKNQKENCCVPKQNKESRGVLSGILFGLLPHSFCLAFIIFSVFGAVTISAVLKNVLVIPSFLFFLIILSIVLATISSVIYLKQKDCLCISGVKRKWKYLLSVYSAIVVINLLMFFVVFPALANFNANKDLKEIASISGNSLATMTIKTKIPCSGHAPLIIDEIKKNNGIYSVKFSLPNVFNITYDPSKVTPKKIISTGTLKTYQATIN